MRERSNRATHVPPVRVERAISFPEVLTVIAIVVFLLALLVPGLGAAKERVRRLLCMNNLRQWGVAGQYYRDEHRGYLPTEGNYLPSGLKKNSTWYNALPPYLGLPSYVDLKGANDAIRALPNIHVWICPSKNLMDAYKSGSGKNQFHYGMNQVLDGLGSKPDGSRDTPGFPDEGSRPIQASRFARRPHTVFMFDIAPNSPAGSPRDVATQYAQTRWGRRLGKFHGDYANFLYLDGAVGAFSTDDLVADKDMRKGAINWHHPQLYWGYPPTRK